MTPDRQKFEDTAKILGFVGTFISMVGWTISIIIYVREKYPRRYAPKRPRYDTLEEQLSEW